VVVKFLFKDSGLEDIKIGSFKMQLKKYLLKIQSMYDETEWYPDNFDLEALSSLRE